MIVEKIVDKALASLTWELPTSLTVVLLIIGTLSYFSVKLAKEYFLHKREERVLKQQELARQEPVQCGAHSTLTAGVDQGLINDKQIIETVQELQVAIKGNGRPDKPGIAGAIFHQTQKLDDYIKANEGQHSNIFQRVGDLEKKSG